MDNTTLVVALSAVISAVVSGAMALLVFIYSQKYIRERYRNKIIRTVFSKLIIKTKDRKASNLLNVASEIQITKIVTKVAYFALFALITSIIIDLHGDTNLVTVVVYLESIYAVGGVFFFLGLGIIGKIRRKTPPEQGLFFYVLNRSYNLYPSEWWLFYLLFLLYFFYEFFAHYNSLIPSLLVLLAYTLILSLMLFMPTMISPVIARYEGHMIDLATGLFVDRMSDVTIKVFTTDVPVEGSVIGIGDELAIKTLGSTRNTVFIPWENIRQFEIVEEIVTSL